MWAEFCFLFLAPLLKFVYDFCNGQMQPILYQSGNHVRAWLLWRNNASASSHCDDTIQTRTYVQKNVFHCTVLFPLTFTPCVLHSVLSCFFSFVLFYRGGGRVHVYYSLLNRRLRHNKMLFAVNEILLMNFMNYENGANNIMLCIL